MDDLTIRLETEKDYRAVEELTREAFWNVYKPGADEHYYVHKMRSHSDFIPELAFVLEKDGKIIGYIFKTSAKGYGGEISVMTAVKPDASVAAVEILDASSETPGLGQNVTKKDFYGEYKDKSHGIVVVKGGNADTTKNEIDAVTGATISSKAVTTAVNQALEYANKIITKGDELK